MDEKQQTELLEAKRRLALVLLKVPENEMSDIDVELLTQLAKDRAIRDELERARKNN